jgi:SAM-dependent methyltransferase
MPAVRVLPAGASAPFRQADALTDLKTRRQTGDTAAVYCDGTYLANNPGWHEEDSPWKARQIARMVRAHGLPLGTIAEVGCGAGEVLRQLSRLLPEGIRYKGFETSPQAFDLCRDKAEENIEYSCEDFFADGSTYDMVMAIDVIEHVEDYLGFLKRLKPRAQWKLFHIPLDLSVQAVLRPRAFRVLRGRYGHLHYFTRETALAALGDCGYGIVDSFYTPGCLELRQRGWRSKLLKLPRRLAFRLSPSLSGRLFGGFSLMVLAR